MDAFVAMAYRQVKKFVRAKARVLSMLMSAVIWVVFFGIGWASSLNVPAIQALLGTDYVSFLIPGVIGITVLTAGLMSGASVIWDRQFGFLKEVLVAPASRLEAISGRMFGDAIVTLIQASIMLALGFAIAKALKLSGVPAVLLIAFVAGFGFTGLGVALASLRFIKSFEAFFAFVNMLMMPMMFASGAFFPLINLPDWFWAITYADPLTYVVDLMRYYLTGISYLDLRLDVIAIVVFDVLAVALALWAFNRTTLD